ncbi:hypothetical protein F2Q70_00018002 [Brassica cretica]|uniref:Uncharacterized protein n=1 Tax=Brassica cretica TaxID=69181 RepID=A0A8S9I3P5_BRACR|nr:hypothetical protein F2Q70_00018002 [Brassica cretica]
MECVVKVLVGALSVAVWTTRFGTVLMQAQGSVTIAVKWDIWLETAEHPGTRKKLVRVVNVQKVISNNRQRDRTWHQGCKCWALRMERTR